MRAVLVGVVALSGCVSSQGRHSDPQSPEREQLETQLDSIKRIDDSIAVMRAVPGVEVRIKPLLFVGWSVAVGNNSDEPIEIDWHGSSFVGSDRQSYGRLLRAVAGEVVGEPLAPTMVPPHSIGGENVRAEQRLGGPPAPVTIEPDADSKINEGTRGAVAYRQRFVDTANGGILYLAIHTSDGDKLWAGRLGHSLPPEQPPPGAATGNAAGSGGDPAPSE